MGPSDFVVDQWKCRHYAQFARHLEHVNFDVLYWLLFLLVILLLFCSSWYYGRSMELVDNAPVNSPQYRRQMKKCLALCTLCTAVAVVAVVMETFALLALQFCDGEDLMMLYWSTWTVLQVGSVIAIFGVMLHIVHSLRGRKHPPWALALGTPVLVVAGLGHIFNSVVHGKFKKARRGRSRSGGEKEPRGQNDTSLSQTTTLRTQSPDDGAGVGFNARLVGYTPEGGPIIQFAQLPQPLNAQASEVVSVGRDGHVMVAFRKEMSAVEAAGEQQQQNHQRPTAETTVGSSSSSTRQPPPQQPQSQPHPPVQAVGKGKGVA